VSTIRHQIAVHAPPSETSASWSHFIDAVITGSQRLACDQLACVDAAHRGMVSFTPAGHGHTTVVFRLEAGGSGPSPAILEQLVTRDLVLFKDYVERGGHEAGRPTPAEKKALLDDEGRRRHQPARARIGERGETAAYVNRFPT
jgi:hypothetical protein